MRRLRFLTALALLLASAAHAQADDDPESLLFTAKNLPVGWTLTADGPVGDTAREQIATRLGAPLQGLWNQVLLVNGVKAQWNVIRAVDEPGARRIEATVSKMRGPDFLVRRGRELAEVAGANLLLARALRAARGVPLATQATWEVAFRLGLLDEGDDGRCNEVFNLLLALEKDPSNAEVPKRIAEAVEPFTFGTTLRLAAPREGWFTADLKMTPEPVKRERDGNVDVYTFRDPPTLQGIPYVDVQGRITVTARFAPSGDPKVEGLREETPWWPTKDSVVLDRARVLTEGATSPRERVLALLRFAALDVPYGGPMGSRHGTRKVLDQRIGRCWDKSDLLVTLCRTAGIPARQVGGWVPPLEAGHVWTEVHLEGEGWIPVDATTTWLGASEDYVPLFLSSDGRMKILHLRMPTIR